MGLLLVFQMHPRLKKFVPIPHSRCVSEHCNIELHCNHTDGWRETHNSDLSSLCSVFSVHKKCGSSYHLDASLRSRSAHTALDTCSRKLSLWTLVSGLFPVGRLNVLPLTVVKLLVEICGNSNSFDY